MFQPDNILNELKALSPLLANVPRVNVYKVPHGYFSNISSQLLLLADASGRSSKTSTGAIPPGYFDSLADAIMNRIKEEADSDVAQETRNISNLVAGIGNKNVYSIPPAYFANLEKDLFGRLSNEDSLLTNNSFNERGQLLATIGNKNVYTIPAAYFENISAELLQKITRPAKVVPLYRKISFVRYAAAAVITGIIGLSVVFLLNKNNLVTPSSAPSVAVMTEARQIIETNNFDQEMEGISDASIVAFLEDKGQDVEAALVASLADDKNLPEADDYIFNNALDDVLNTLDLNN